MMLEFSTATIRLFDNGMDIDLLGIDMEDWAGSFFLFTVSRWPWGWECEFDFLYLGKLIGTRTY